MYKIFFGSENQFFMNFFLQFSLEWKRLRTYARASEVVNKNTFKDALKNWQSTWLPSAAMNINNELLTLTHKVCYLKYWNATSMKIFQWIFNCWGCNTLLCWNLYWFSILGKRVCACTKVFLSTQRHYRDITMRWGCFS